MIGGRKGEKSREERRRSDREKRWSARKSERRMEKRGIEKGRASEKDRRRWRTGGRMGGGEIENERPLAQKARPTGSLLSSSLLSGLSRARGFVTCVSPSLGIALSLFLPRPVSLVEHDTSHVAYISFQKFCILAKTRDGNVE